MLKRLLRKLMEGAAPVAPQPRPEPAPIIRKDQDLMEREAEFGEPSRSYHAYLEECYVGPRTGIAEQIAALRNALPKWRNACFGAAAETEQFVQARMRDDN